MRLRGGFGLLFSSLLALPAMGALGPDVMSVAALTNNTGAPANDLHVTFNRPPTSLTDSDFAVITPEGGDGLQYVLSGTEIAAGSTAGLMWTNSGPNSLATYSSITSYQWSVDGVLQGTPSVPFMISVTPGSGEYIFRLINPSAAAKNYEQLIFGLDVPAGGSPTVLPGGTLEACTIEDPELCVLELGRGNPLINAYFGFFDSEEGVDVMHSYGSPVPEPGSLGIAAAGIGLILLLRKRLS